MCYGEKPVTTTEHIEGNTKIRTKLSTYSPTGADSFLSISMHLKSVVGFISRQNVETCDWQSQLNDVGKQLGVGERRLTTVKDLNGKLSDYLNMVVGRSRFGCKICSRTLE
ncbi:hypothetical protein GW17_00049176 [Ensete ventricosum]|nr:hypothetical protein GW17_00049176 [Ensete ventricosum]RZR86079.1 hypothetical protein BHM03_00013175 [Ensete ventricosum]